MTPVERDDLVAGALRDLPVPDHLPGFWSSLERAIAAEGDGGSGRGTTDRRLDTGEIPSVRSLAHERARRRGRGPWLAVAAAVLVLAGAVGVVALAGDVGDDDGTEVAGESADEAEDLGTSAAPPESGGATSTVVPETGSIVMAASTPVEAAQRWLDALGAGDRDAAAALLGPRSLSYIASLGGDPAGLMAEYEEGYGAWAGSPDLELASVDVGPVDLLGPGAQLTIVTVAGTYPGEGDPAFRIDVLPVVAEGDQLRVEPAAHLDSRPNRLVFTLPSSDETGALGSMGPSDDINVFVPAEGTVFFQIDGGEPFADATSPVGQNAEPFALHNPPQDLAPGSHRLVVVAVGADGTITTFGGTFEVQG